ncbi:unnamed protein product [Moneuplotes crassus]|uniref:Uncharacterized protein n=1 Tax=Euplotes crassus TaxID=5936 RepID=A0AAD1X8C8_EUPCR|nr:unnamed protein product [Moneuplotes crassus]
MKLIAIALCLLALSSAKVWNPHMHDDKLFETAENSNVFWYEQRLDHFNPQKEGTFQQRYYDIDQYWDPETGPLFLYICGEGTCRQPADNSFVVNLAKKFNGRVLALEHRFYGETQPTEDWSTENLQFLTPDQGLADLAQFATDKSREFSEQYGIPHRRWICVGGSYPGALSAWFRYKYPHVAFASLSSSGVVNAIPDYHQYDEQVFFSTSKSGSLCPERFVKAHKYIESIVNSGNRLEAFKTFGYDKDMVDGEFYYFIGDLIAGPVQYGGRTDFCDGLMAVDDDMDQIINYLVNFAKGMGLVLEQYTAEFTANTTIDYDKNMRQWTYQTCANLGYFQTPAKAEGVPPMRPANIEVDFWEEFCERVFGINIFPDADHWNARYGATSPATTKIIFTNGGEDPWQHAGVTETKNPHLIPIVIDCDNCAHCVDLGGDHPTDAPELTEARARIADIFEKWIQQELEMERSFPTEAKANLRELLSK